ncbi:MAG: fasciclin domain-containing protein [Bacteroidaceae bacterium]|nr:fasciclin domain-containing protein [Bacteroidaceae bacterium]
MKTLRRYSVRIMSIGLVMSALILFPSCLAEQHPGTLYTFTGQTVADYLEDDPDGRFTDFITVLKRARHWGELDTYGEFTCFAPTNSAFAEFLADLGYSSVDDLSDSDCDTITRTHLIKATYFMSDLNEGALPSVNLLERFLTLSYAGDTAQDGTIRLLKCINRDSHIIGLDDTVQNGVVQVVDKLIKVSGDYIFDIIKENQGSRIFFQALNLVGLEDSLKKFKDESYFVSYDSSEIGLTKQGGGSDYSVKYWAERKSAFTILVEPDSVFERNGIHNLDELIAYAKKVYDESYPADAGLYDDDWHNRKNPLNRFISYHILPFQIPANVDFCAKARVINNRFVLEYLDPEDYFETYMPHSIIRVSRVMSGADAGMYINRRGIGSTDEPEFGRPKYRGVRIYSTDEMTGSGMNEGCNGYYHHIDDILVYSDFVRNDILNRRMRIDCCTLSPDFITSGARQKMTSSAYEGTGFKEPLNFHSYNSDYCMWVRVASTSNWSYQGDGLDLQGNYDILMKLPPVPFDGTWELRLSYRGYEGCGVVQNYVGDSPDNMQPCGIPTDLRLSASANHNIGWETDDEKTEEEINAIDKAMHNRGYMKAPDSHTNGTDAFRTLNTMARRIVTTDYFYAEKDYYLRMKLVLDNPKAEMNFDYMEWCPKSIYDNNEDKH